MRKTVRTKITMPRLREIIAEEVASLQETVDHTGIRDVVTAASKLLAAVEQFETKQSGPMQSAMVPHLTAVKELLEDMVSSPASYVHKPKLEPQKVSLKPAKAEKVV